MRLGLAAIALAAVTGFAVPTDSLPQNTVPLSQMMRALSAQPGFTEAFLQQIEGGEHRTGAALLTPVLVDHLRKLILGKDWAALSRFPGWTMSEITPTVGAISRISSVEETQSYLDLGPYALNEPKVIDLAEPSPLPGFSTADVALSLGNGVTRGDGPGPLAAGHADSQRLADALNRLSANGIDGAARFEVESPLISLGRKGIPFEHSRPDNPPVVHKIVASFTTPQDLIEELQNTGHSVTVADSRFFANFGHLHWNGQDVMTPFFVNAEILVPGTNRPLLVPVSHAEYEWHIRGPLLNADVSLYVGIDGKAEFRTMDELDQQWVMKRDAHTYTGADAVEVTRLSGLLVQTYVRLHQAYPAMPFHGYYAFGVCQDLVAAIELKMTGKATLFPNTADNRLFTNPRDAEINDLVRRLPKDRDGAPPDVERVFASLPVGSSEDELAKVTIPGLGADLVATHRAWMEGRLERTESPLHRRLRLLGLTLAFALALVFAWRTMRRRRHANNG